MTLTSKNI